MANTFQLETAEIIQEAFELVGEELRTGYDLTRARRSLNIMLQDWANRGINLWKVERKSFPLTPGLDHVVLDKGDIDVIDASILHKNQYYPLNRSVRADYLTIPNKAQTGRPTEIYMERTIVPAVHYWPIPKTHDYELVVYVMKNIDTVENNVDSPNIPSRFLYALVTGLAFQLAMKVAPDRAERVGLLAHDALQRATNEDSERGNLHITPMGCY